MNSKNASVFVSYNHADKEFARKLAADLKVSGAEVWVDEAELRVGDSLISKITAAIDRVDYLAAILSPNSAASRWVQEELQHALVLQIDGQSLIVLPVLLADCEIPGFLRSRLYADFRDSSRYEDSLERLLKAMGIGHLATAGAIINDPLAKKYDRVESFYARPKMWYCVECGAKAETVGKGYVYNNCRKCKAERPFMDGDQTVEQCAKCRQFNIAGATYCEWCGASMEGWSGR